ncbi:MAG: iron-containing alcohol dehydrogenase [Planctomycetaceae bacterium]|nr:iron-containing alcohol dehydrogenase [Planctomycetaceae bacterium]
MHPTPDDPNLFPVPTFDFSLNTRVVSGPGTLSRLGDLVTEYGGSRVLLVTDQGLAHAGHEQHATQALGAAGHYVAIYDDVSPNPTTADVERALQCAQAHRIDFIVGLGGGSSMDCAKGVNFLLTNGGRMEDYWGVGKAKLPMLPLIAVPTTAGTGSEAQSFALIAHAETHMKMACGDKKAAAKVAILDPELTMTMPRHVAAVTAIDALSHAVETYVTKRRNPVSSMFSREAWRLLIRGFPRIFEDDADLQARNQMLLGAHWAGAAIEQSMLGAAHALANPLSAHFNTVHGIAVGIMLPHVIRFNRTVVPELYGELAELAGLCPASDLHATDKLADYVASLVALTGIPRTLREADVDRSLLTVMADEASRQWTGNFNPRDVRPELMQELYECAWSN